MKLLILIPIERMNALLEFTFSSQGKKPLTIRRKENGMTKSNTGDMTKTLDWFLAIIEEIKGERNEICDRQSKQQL